MDTAQTTRLCAIFELGEPLYTPQPVQGGMIHKLWQLHTARGTFAVKQLNPEIMRREGIRDMYRLTERIAQAMALRGVPAVVALKGEGDGGTVQDIDIATYIVYNWIEGETLSAQAVEPERARLIGASLAHMHDLPHQDFPELQLSDHEPFDEDEWDMLTFQASDRDIPWTHQVRRALPLLVEWGKLATEANSVLNRSLVISHRDLDQKNVIWRNETSPVFVDWESAGLTNPTKDIVETALYWSGQTVQPPREDSFHAVLEGYITSGGTIPNSGIHALHSVMGTWLAWLLFNMHRSLGESVSSEEERQLAVRETTHTLSTLYALNTNAEIWAQWVERWRTT